MASSFGSFSMLVSLAILFMFISPTFCHEKDEENHLKLKKLCSKTDNGGLCMKFMKSDSRTVDADNRALTEVAIDLASSKAKDIHKKLNSLYDKTSNSRMKDRYNSCSKNYHDAMRDLEETKRLFNDHDYKRILVQVNDVVEEVHDCKNQLDKLEKGVSGLKKKAKEFELLCDVIKVAA
ncbi:pectinesterase inhibitor-like [Actinidia eriantha]|uniref:pectinesterase inhibitor-like n=1 Tax=Actinidia eriantha TaxID=165200 RepID=UPI002588EB83|nr:pectinesterase inhibitor-like [Actinidia eriantha]